jgi:hypothetical protein
MLKRWDTRNYDIELILAVFDSISINIESEYSKTKEFTT